MPSRSRLDRLGVLVDPHAQALGGRLQPPGQPGRVDQRGPADPPQAAGVGGGVDLGAHRVGVEPPGVLAQAAQFGLLGPQLRQVARRVLGRGHVDHARALEVAVDVVPVDGVLDGVQVLETELLQQLELGGEALLPVGDAVRQGRLHEPAVAAAGGRPDLGGVDQHDVPFGVTLLGDDRRPEPRVAAADDAQVAALVAHERRVGVGFVDVVVPVREQVGVGDGVEVAPVVDHRGIVPAFDRWRDVMASAT